jgi:hypothetical protein
MLLPLAMASSALTSTPTALVADLVDGGQRSQALSLLRTAGDAGERACYAPESVVWCAVVWSCLFFFCIRDWSRTLFAVRSPLEGLVLGSMTAGALAHSLSLTAAFQGA